MGAFGYTILFLFCLAVAAIVCVNYAAKLTKRKRLSTLTPKELSNLTPKDFDEWFALVKNGDHSKLTDPERVVKGAMLLKRARSKLNPLLLEALERHESRRESAITVQPTPLAAMDDAPDETPTSRGPDLVPSPRSRPFSSTGSPSQPEATPPPKTIAIDHLQEECVADRTASEDPPETTLLPHPRPRPFTTREGGEKTPGA